MPLDGEYEPNPTPWVRAQVELYESSHGAEGVTDPLHGRPTVILTSRGARSGKLRKTPLMRVEHDGRYAAVASLGGAPTNPSWYHNLTSNPLVELQDGPERRDMRARQLRGEEREIWWERAVSAFPEYAVYQTKTTRLIPVFLLEPSESLDRD
jgi:deazaflavin-dependent oxidoreductase (nitroreductase family)